MSLHLSGQQYEIHLESDHWRCSEDGNIAYWDSLGEVGIPAAQLEAEQYFGIADNWAALRFEAEGLTLLADLPRSRALLYSRVGARWIVSDSVAEIRRCVEEWARDCAAAAAFELTGFTLNERTLVSGVAVVEAASAVFLPYSSDRSEIGFWGVPLYRGSDIRDSAVFSRDYDQALREAFASLIDRTSGRQLVIPLSGGLDSRLIASLLKSFGARDLLAFSYGRQGSSEAEIARSVAHSLGIEFVFVPMEISAVRADWFGGNSEGFKDATWSASALPHIQDWYALRWLQQRGIARPGAVFLPGHTPVGMFHHQERLTESPTESDIVDVLAEHHVLNSAEKKKLLAHPEFSRAVQRTLDTVPKGPRWAQNVVEWFNYRERQAKYINNSMRAYEFFGWSWALPLYWPGPLKVWLAGDARQTRDRAWYTRFVDGIYADVTGTTSAEEYFLPPAEGARVPFRKQIVSLSRKSGLNRLASRLWEIRVQVEHPLALEAFVSSCSRLRLALLLVRYRTLMRMWTESFLKNEWGDKNSQRVPLNPLKAAGDQQPKVLIISYSDIERDARVRRQIDELAPNYQVTVLGHGEEFDVDAELILFPPPGSKWTEGLRSILLHAKLYRFAQLLEADNLCARRLLRRKYFDAVLTNDIEPVGMAVDLFGWEKVHADLHEYYPGLQDQDPAWVRLRKPYYEWMLSENAGRAASTTTVSQRIANRYEEESGLAPSVVRNATTYAELRPTPVRRPLRLVHSGAALPNRRIEETIEAVSQTRADVTLDLFLTQPGTEYYRHLKMLAGNSNGRVTLHPAVDPSDLVRVLNQYDVGVFLLPPTTTNYALALPNKLFDFVQARLAVVVGPSESMAEMVREFDLGAVTDGFGVSSLQAALEEISEDDVRRWKQNADRAAIMLDGAREAATWTQAISSISGGLK